MMHTLTVTERGTAVGPAALGADAPARTLAAENVIVRFGGLTALSGVSVHVTTRELVGVIGPNGAGKTTLFNVMCGLVRPNRGRLVLDGQPIPRMRSGQLTQLGIAR